MISRSASGEGESLNARMIHCSFGSAKRRARITATISQFRTMSTRSVNFAMGSAADDEVGSDMIDDLSYRFKISRISNIVKLRIEERYVEVDRRELRRSGATRRRDPRAPVERITTSSHLPSFDSCKFSRTQRRRYPCLRT